MPSLSPLGASLSPAAPDEALPRAAKEVESLILKQLLQSSGAFKAAQIPGGSVYADLFTQTLAEAVAASGGLGLANQLVQTLSPKPSAPATAPVLGGPSRLTSGFGVRADPVNGHPAMHNGMDLAAPEGTPIRAAMPGVVVRAGERGGYGNAVEVEHGDGLRTLYAHASTLAVRAGDRVEAGQTLGTVGATGKATGAHLHFELRQDGRALNPARALKAYAGRAEEPAGEVP